MHLTAARSPRRHRHNLVSALWARLEPLSTERMALAVPPPHDSRFGRPFELLKVRWVKPKLVVDVTFLTWTDDGLLRQVAYRG
jgi:bifunctional non-homologous end joining protein LigD